MIKRVKLIFWSYSSQISSILSNLILVVVLTRILGVRNFGIWIQAVTAISFTLEILCLNLGHALLRFSATRTFEERSNIFWISVLTQWGAHFLTIVIILPFSGSIGNLLFNRVDSLTVIIIIIISGLMAFQNLMRNFLISYDEAIFTGEFTSISTFLTTLIIITGGVLFKSFEGALYGMLVGRFLENLILFFFIRNKISYPHFNFSLFSRLISFSLPLLPVGIAFWVCQLSDRFFINHYIGLEAVAKYGVSYSLPAMVSLIYMALANVFFSLLVNLYELKQYQQVSWWISSIIRIYIVISTSLVCSFFVASKNIVLLLGGENYLYQDVAQVFLWIGVGSIVFGIFQIYSRQYDLEQRNLQISRNWIMAMVTNLVLNILLIPRLGIIGAAFSTVVAYCVGFVMALTHKFEKFNIDFKEKQVGLFLLVSFPVSIFIQPYIGSIGLWGIFIAGLLGLLLCFCGILSGVISIDLLKQIFHYKIKMSSGELK